MTSQQVVSRRSIADCLYMTRLNKTIACKLLVPVQLQCLVRDVPFIVHVSQSNQCASLYAAFQPLAEEPKIQHCHWQLHLLHV